MAKKTTNLSNKKAGVSPRKSGSSSGKGTKVILLLLLLVAMLAGVGFFYQEELVSLLSSDDEMMSSLSEEAPPKNNSHLQVENSADQAKQPTNAVITTTLPSPQNDTKMIAVPVPVTKQAPPAKRKRYYVKIGSCFYSNCVQEYKNMALKNDLPAKTYFAIRSTRYFEVISKEAYTKERAEEKRILLRRKNNYVTDPVLVKDEGDYYRISFGSFVDKISADKMLSHLGQLYMDVTVVFHIVEKREKYKATDVFAGAFKSRSSADDALAKLSSVGNRLRDLEVVYR